MKLRRLRDGDVVGDDMVLVRGGELDADVLRADAQRYHGMYGTYGISPFAGGIRVTRRHCLALRARGR
jgi:hypothetical protein